MSQRRAFSPTAWGGMATYLLITFVLAWVPALLLRQVFHQVSGPWVTRLLVASLVYAATMGWQPLLAALVVRRWFEWPDPLDQGVRPAAPRFALLASAAPLALVAASMGIAWLIGRAGVAAVPLRVVEAASAGDPARPGLLLPLALVAAIAILYVQCFCEEYGWRGYFLSRAMRELGPRRGLLVHGVVWGVWYAPPFLLATDQLSRGALRCAAFVLTCTLLGTLLGWVRLASRSIMPSVIANGVLTVVGGLPFILQDTDVGLRGTSYGPAGWLPLLAAAGLVLFGRWRSALVVPERPSQGATVPLWALLGRPARPGADPGLPN